MNALPLFTAALLGSFIPGGILHAQEPARSQKREQPESPVQAKAEKLVLDRISFAEADITDVLAHIGKKAQEADAAEKSGVNIVLNAGETKPPAVTMDMRNLRVWDALTVVSKVAGLEVSVIPGAILLHSPELKPKDRKVPGVTDSAAWKAIAGVKVDRINFLEADVRDVCEHFKKKAGDAGKVLNFLPAGTESPPLTFDVRNTALTDILEIAAELCGQEIVSFDTILLMRPPAKPDKEAKSAAAPEWMKSAAWKQAEKITINRISFSGAAAADVAAYLGGKSKEADKTGQGVSLAVSPRTVAEITIDVREARVSDIVRVLAAIHGLEISVVEDHILLGKPK